MEDASALALALSFAIPLLGMLASAVVPVVLVAMLLRRLRSGAGTPAAGCLSFVRKGLLLAAMPASLFVGLMIASIGGAIHPAVVEVALPWVCEGGDAQLHTQGYSYKPGQHGTSMVFTCRDAQGEPRDITLKLLGAATLFYSAILAAILLPLAWLAGRFMRPPSGFGAAQGGAATVTATGSGDVNDALRDLADRMRQAHAVSTGSTDAGATLRDAIDHMKQVSSATVTVNGRPVDADPAMIDGLLRTIGKHVHADAAGGGAHGTHASDGDIGERLLRLRALHRSGAIGDADYEATKAAILREL